MEAGWYSESKATCESCSYCQIIYIWQNFAGHDEFASTHHKNDEKCKSHYIRAVVLEDMVWMHMETVISYILHYEDHFRAVVQDS